mgnify:CR=1 FL=1
MDSQVDEALGIYHRVVSDFELRLQQNRVILQAMIRTKQSLLQDSQVRTVLSAFTQTFTADDLSKEKELDFLLWALGGLKIQ